MWKLHTMDTRVQPPIKGHDSYVSEEQALRRACDYIRRPLHVQVTHIEKPDGTSIELDAIKRWCDAQPKDG